MLSAMMSQYPNGAYPVVWSPDDIHPRRLPVMPYQAFSDFLKASVSCEAAIVLLRWS